jgi:exodeoxyribonuclease VII small subunit
MSDKDPKDLGFEELVERVEQVVKRMQEGGLDLEVMLKDYEAGMAWLREAEARLRGARARLEELTPEPEEEGGDDA